LWVAALASEESFYKAGLDGYNLMAIPMSGAVMRPLLQTYRQAYRTAAHPGQGKVILAFHMYCAPTDREAHDTARPLFNAYLQRLATAASAWDTTTSKDYKGYPELIARLKRQNFEGLVASGAAWVGSPETIRDTIQRFVDEVEGFDSASLQVMNGPISEADAERSIRLFADQVMPALH
jgi:alkanesulfonate monooxygenase SsuD/methylene tetrahydromethanopterin reductase-like flavin-dependent oxidoreductase (luciferase family)